MSSKIIKLTSEHVKRLQAVEITPHGELVVIGGRNGAGKSSVLDSIQYALGGDPEAQMPVHKGQAKARVVVDLGDLIVKRTFTAAGGTALVVTDGDGVKQSSPQEILDKLTGKLTFDPLEFQRAKPEAQGETLRKLVNLDFTEHDAQAKAIYDERTAVNREAAKLKGAMSTTPRYENVPAEETPLESILAEQQLAAQVNQRNATIRTAAAGLKRDLEAVNLAISGLLDTITAAEAEIRRQQGIVKTAQARLDDKKQERILAQQAVADVEQSVAKLEDRDLTGFEARLREVQATNAKVRVNAERAKLAKDYRAKVSEAEQLTDRLATMEAERRRRITEAKYPIDGLGFDSSLGVTYQGIPFGQCSSAEQLRVSVAIGMALNPQLRILLIRDGSLLDVDSLDALGAMAKQHDYQVWIERVGADDRTSVIIEDGTARAVEALSEQAVGDLKAVPRKEQGLNL